MTSFFNFFIQHKWALLIMFSMLMPTSVYADEYSSSAHTLGWVSIGTGATANLLFIGFNAVRRLPLLKVGIGSEIPKTGFLYRPMLNLHMMLNSVGFFAGASHGILLLDGLDSISLSLAIVMTVSMASGILLKLASDRNLKFFGRLVHGQAILSVLLVFLIVLHVFTADGDFD